jgi:hypothetical protein
MTARRLLPGGTIRRLLHVLAVAVWLVGALPPPAAVAQPLEPPDPSAPKLVAFGDNTYGQLGDGSMTSRSTFDRVGQIGPAAAFAAAAGVAFTLALIGDGQVWAWGQRGYLGDGSPVSLTLYTSVPAPVPGLGDVRAIAAGQTIQFSTDGGLSWQPAIRQRTWVAQVVSVSARRLGSSLLPGARRRLRQHGRGRPDARLTGPHGIGLTCMQRRLTEVELT